MNNKNNEKQTNKSYSNNSFDELNKNSTSEFGEENIIDFVDDYSHTVSKGNEEQDIRFNSNNNRERINQIKTNQSKR